VSELLDDYTKATFPMELTWSGCGKVRLLAAFQNRVVGVSYGTFERDGETVEYLSQVLDWDGQGKFGTGDNSYPDMDLPPPPAKQAECIAAWEEEIAQCEGRLKGMPDAPQEWRRIDESRIAHLRAKITELIGREP